MAKWEVDDSEHLPEHGLFLASTKGNLKASKGYGYLSLCRSKDSHKVLINTRTKLLGLASGGKSIVPKPTENPGRAHSSSLCTATWDEPRATVGDQWWNVSSFMIRSVARTAENSTPHTHSQAKHIRVGLLVRRNISK